MNNAAGEVAKIPLTVFGGAVTEMAPSDLPEGASPYNQDCDFLPGSVFTRGGRSNVISYANLFVENLTGVAVSLAGTLAPNESPWLTPNNARLNVPGTYASTSLNGQNAGVVNSAFKVQSQNISGTVSLPMTNTAGNTLLALYHPQQASGTQTFGDTLGNNWISINKLSDPNTNQLTWLLYCANCKGGANTINANTQGGVPVGAAITVLELSGIVGINPLDQSAGGGYISTGSPSTLPAGPVTTGSPNTLAIAFYEADAGSATITYTAGTGWTTVFSGAGTLNTGGPQLTSVFAEVQAVPVSGTVVNATALSQAGANVDAFLVTFKMAGNAPQSQILQATNFNFNISTLASIAGLEVEVSGNQGPLSSDVILTAKLILPDGTTSSKAISLQLPAADAQVFAGSISEGWGAPLTAAMLNNPAFGVQLVASAAGGSPASFAVYAVKVKAFLTPSPPQNFNYLKTYEQQNSGVFTLALDAGGTLWQEDAVNNAGSFSAVYTAIQPGSFAKSITFQNTEYIAFTDLIQGTDMPRQWTGSNFDRVSCVGPAAAPQFATTANGSTVTSITQNTPIVLIPNGTNPNAYLLVSAGPSAHGTFGTPSTPGNVMSIFLQSTDIPPAYFKAGTNIVLSGFPLINGKQVNNDPTGVTNPAYYTISTVGAPIPGQNAYVWITFQVPFTTFFNPRTPAGCQIQATTATLVMAAQVPYLEVGNQFTLTGVAPAGWNNSFTVLQTPNAAVLAISQTLLSGNVAQYVYSLVSGTAPVVGQYINVNGTLNGNGIFNVLNAVITSVSPNSFSVTIQSPNITASAEANAFGSIYGTVFVFDPAGTVTNPIIGNAGAIGSLATTGVIGVGIRKAVCIFKKRNGALTAPSPFAQFNITGTATAIASSSIPIGPPDTVARIIAFTGAGGGNYFWIPQAVTVTSNGQQVTYSATLINDNVSTQATFSFPDAVLLAATAIDIQGNNLFAQQELGACRGFLTYADRLIAWGVQNKIQNLLNLSFDGGIGVQNLQQLSIQPAVTNYPLGWIVDAVNGAGGQLLTSPLYGNSYYVKNATGGTAALYGMITQPAYTNQVGTPIVLTSTLYSVRLAARCPSGVVTGSLVCDLFSPTLNQAFGSFTVPLSTMTSNFNIFTGAMLVNPFQIVPKDLVFRVYLANVPNNGDCEIDRVEPFPTAQPTLSTQFFASYAFNQEAYDGVTGLFGPAQNQQRCNGGLVLFDTLYMLKENSWFSTSDNGVTEPYKWNWRTVSEKVGTVGINSYDSGEGWALSACRAGVYFFEGGEPLKISQEIQTVWDLINWKAGSTIWLRNDPATKTVRIGVPIPTPNKYMPEFPVNANPTTPNVILALSYRELNSGAELARIGPIRSTFSGRLMSPEPARKWSFWNIRCPYADMIDRGNNSQTMLFGTGYSDSKIFQLLASQLSDDGAAINSFYITCGLPTPEQAAQHGVDVLRMQFDYVTLNVNGSGAAAVMIYPEDPGNQPPFPLDTLPLDAIAQGNSEAAVNMTGNRAFLRVGTNAVGAAFSLSEVVSLMSADPWAPIRGTARGKL